MSHSESEREDVIDSEAENDPEVLSEMEDEREENVRFQTYRALKQYPPGHVRLNRQEYYVEVIQQPPTSVKTGLQCVASSGRILFAANGPDVHSFDILDKTHLSTWRWPKEKNFPEIPEALTTTHDPNRPMWAPQPGEEAEAEEGKDVEAEAEEEKDAEAEAELEKDAGAEAEQKKDAGKRDAQTQDAKIVGQAAKRRKLNSKEHEDVPDQSPEPDEPAGNGDETGATDDSAADNGVDKLDPHPPRPTNPGLWHSGLEKGGKPEPLLNYGEGMDIEGVKYEKGSTKAPDVKPEGWIPNEDTENWRRPEFREQRRLEWNHQPSTATPDIPMVQCMSVTADGKHVVAVTGTDKTIWVFKHDGNGKLSLLSQRTMPKRPNAIALANKDRTILCADKFGDVYALPLIDRKHVPIKATPALLSRSATPATAKPFQSQANEKTVHSKRNLEALENQKKQLEKAGSSTPDKGYNPKKDPTGDFEHKLIIGHVSMLTDIAVGRVPVKDKSGGKTFHKEVIITADRDEHIRVSRGMPQSHVIENFLLGHKEFVSRVHIPKRHPNLLISGGGDSYIYIWDFTKAKLLSKQDMRSETIRELDPDTQGPPPLAVSGITSYYDKAIGQTRVFVICENIPEIFSFHINDQLGFSEPAHTSKIALAANPLSITPFSTSQSQGIIVTFDPWTAGPNVYPGSESQFIQMIVPTGDSTPPDVAELLIPDECSETIAFTFRGDWQRALYGIEPLRKNCFDRDASNKDGRGDWGAKPSTG